MLWWTLEKNVPVASIKPSFNTFNNRLSVQSQPNYVPWLFVFFFLLFFLSDWCGSLWKNKAFENMPDNFLKTLQLWWGVAKNGRPSERNVICMILSLLNCSVWCGQGCIKKASIYAITISVISSCSLLLPSRLECLLQRSSSKTPFQNKQLVTHSYDLCTIHFPHPTKWVIHFMKT